MASCLQEIRDSYPEGSAREPLLGTPRQHGLFSPGKEDHDVHEMAFADLQQLGQWSPTAEVRALKVNGDKGTLLIRFGAERPIIRLEASQENTPVEVQILQDDYPAYGHPLDLVQVEWGMQVGIGADIRVKEVRAVGKTAHVEIEGTVDQLIGTVEGGPPSDSMFPSISIDTGGKVRDFTGSIHLRRVCGELNCERPPQSDSLSRLLFARAGGDWETEGPAQNQSPGRILSISDVGPTAKLTGVDITGLRRLPVDELKNLSVFTPDAVSLKELTVPFDRLTYILRIRRITRIARDVARRSGLLTEEFSALRDPLGFKIRQVLRHPDACTDPRLRSRPCLYQPNPDGQTSQEQANWFRDLDKATQSQVVPASTRALVRWCYTLLEHESIKPRWVQQSGTGIVAWFRRRWRCETLESIGRWFHRCAGYGQRPSRAFASWLIAAGAVTFWSHYSNAGPSGGNPFGYLEALFSPVSSVLRLRSSESGTETATLVGAGVYEPLAYLAVGLPFIFFVISLREFFRSPLNPRS